MSDLTIGKLAQAAGVGVETIRFYERRGLMQEPPRRASGYRQYPARSIRRLTFIRQAKDLGFTLKEIQELLELRASSDRTCGEMRNQLEIKIADIDRRLTDLQAMKGALVELHRTCDSTDPRAECPILDALESSQRC